MAYSQTDLDALKAAYASGVLEVEYNGRRTRFQNSADLERAIARIEAELSPASAAPRRTAAVYSSGLQSTGIDRRRG